MKIKRFEAISEQEAISKIKDELGESAVILNIKKIKPRGIFKLFSKNRVEVMAAYESPDQMENNKITVKENNKNKSNNKKSSGNKNNLKKNNKNNASNKNTSDKNISDKNISDKNDVSDKNNVSNSETDTKTNLNNADYAHDMVVKDFKIQEQQIKIKNLESKLSTTEELLNNFASQLSNTVNNSDNRNIISTTRIKLYSNTIVQLFYDTLIKNGVANDIAEKILDGVDNLNENNNSNINMLVKIVYNRIMEILGPPQPIVLKNKNDKYFGKVVICMGPTGVGKTTTIAKLCSHFVLSKNLKVGLITADTYRIAAVEQIRTYADIFGINLSVVYDPTELNDVIKKNAESNDIVFIDTAGRSHKNTSNIKDLESILFNVPNSDRFLVLSATTKFEDLLSIIDVYSDLTDYKLIFTKIDETSSLGVILNVCYVTKKPLSYITDGQDVPDDIKLAQSELIARTLLGSSDA